MGGETAMIADPRNDEHLILSGMQAAFLMFHNNVVDMLRDDGEDRRVGAGDDRADARLFARARQISTPLFQLPLAAIASHDLPISLPQRNLLRHLTWSLPSGQAIEAQMGNSTAGTQSAPPSYQPLTWGSRTIPALVLRAQGGRGG
jgi:hypothetical protein